MGTLRRIGALPGQDVGVSRTEDGVLVGSGGETAEIDLEAAAHIFVRGSRPGSDPRFSGKPVQGNIPHEFRPGIRLAGRGTPRTRSDCRSQPASSLRNSEQPASTVYVARSSPRVPPRLTITTGVLRWPPDARTAARSSPSATSRRTSSAPSRARERLHGRVAARHPLGAGRSRRRRPRRGLSTPAAGLAVRHREAVGVVEARRRRRGGPRRRPAGPR